MVDTTPSGENEDGRGRHRQCGTDPVDSSFPSPRGMVLAIWAGILARHLSSPCLPKHCSVACGRSRQAYSSGGCTGMAAHGGFTGFPFNDIPDRE
jgi:hypothetical protein